MKANGIELHVVGEGGGAALVWAHGLLSSMASEDWHGTFHWDRLTAYARVIRYDARGHGLSAGSHEPQDYHWSNLARDMLAVMDGMRIHALAAGGQSMGCATSLYAALAAPQRVTRLVLVSPPTAWETRPAQAAIYAQMADLVKAHGAAALAARGHERRPAPPWRPQPATPQPDLFAEGAEPDEQTLIALLRGASLCDLPPREDLQALHMPALILAWADDPAHPLSTAEALSRLLPASHLWIARRWSDVTRWPQLIHDFVSAR